MSRPPEASGPDPQRVAELLAEACEIPPEARRDWVERKCGEDPQLRDEVVSLLAFHQETWIEPLAAGRAAALLSAALVPIEPEIGPYRVDRLLGEGGMGTVYLAQRVEGGFEQQVALKVVKRGMDTEAILSRFHRERQILARLEHPAIARLLDGGSTPDGRPYFAMEYVEGIAITAFARARDLGVGELLTLVLEVCEAVQHAHRNLVVHRDLKPSNVLVTREGRVKLVDFGIAKVLDPEEATANPVTRVGGRLLTLDYASPEQALGAAVTTSSDIYSLGVLLYELLTGRFPYEPAPTTGEQKLQAVCHAEPLLASAAVRRQDPGEVGERRARQLRGDLDAVLAKALEKDPERRYASVEALAEDLQRHLRAEPVRARPPAARYRLVRFVQRHRLGVSLGSAAVLALLLGLAGTAWQARVAAVERDRAAAHAIKAEAVQDFLTSLLQSVDPYRTGGAPWTAEELLARGLERIAVLGDAGVQAELLAVMGGVSRSLGQLEQAEDLWRRSLALRQQLSGADSVELGEGERGLAAVLYARGGYAEAETLLLQAMARERRRQAEASEDAGPALAKTLEQLGVLCHELERHDEARLYYQEALDILRAEGGHRAEIAGLLVNLGGLHQARDELDQAEVLQREALAIEREVLGPHHPGLAVTLGNLAVTLRRRGDYTGAEQLHREALAINRAAFGDKHPQVATQLSNLAVVLRARGSYAEAAEVFREVLVLDRELLGERHAYVGFSLDNLAMALAELGEHGEAMGLFETAHEILLESRGATSVEVGTNFSAQAVALRLAGRADEALPLLERALAIYRNSLPADHPRVTSALGELAAALAALGRVEEAEARYRETLALRRGAGASIHPETVPVLTGLGRLLVAAGQLDEASQLLQEGVEIAGATLPAGHLGRDDAELALAAGLAASGARGDARARAEAVTARLATQTGPRAQILQRHAAEILAER